MSTVISIRVDTLTRERAFPSDARATAALVAFHDAYALGPADASNEEKLDAIIDYWVQQVVDVSLQQYVEAQRASNLAAARELYKFNERSDRES